MNPEVQGGRVHASRRPEVQRGRAQTLRGVVVGDKMAKTVIVEVRRTVKHSLYHKSMRRRQRFFVHDEKKEAKVGDKVIAIACRPLSRHKHFQLFKVLEKVSEQ